MKIEGTEWGDGEKVKRRNEGAEARERGRSIEGILIPILLFLPHSCRIEEAFMMGYRFMARLRRYYACIGRSRGGKKGDDGGGGRYLYDFRYLPRWGERGTEREREGGRLERVALWSIVKIMKPKRDFSLFNWRPQTISRLIARFLLDLRSHDQSERRNCNFFDPIISTFVRILRLISNNEHV